MLAIHFGGGNIGRGFIGEVLHENGFEIAFIDVNKDVISALNAQKKYSIELAEEGRELIEINNVYGINNGEQPEKVVEAFQNAAIVTTAIGPKVLTYIAPLIAEGIRQRKVSGDKRPLDIIACENMIGGSDFLKSEVAKHLSNEELAYVEESVGFPNAAVDRIVPLQTHNDPLFVSVEPYKEWVIDETAAKNKNIRLKNVHYVSDLEPFIERKLFTVNTGHAAAAYTGKYSGYSTIDEALKNELVKEQVKRVLKETGLLLAEKWGFNKEEHQAYIDKILSRFANPYISDDISRVARTPIRKLGYNERFIRPIREAAARHLPVEALIQTVAKMLVYRDDSDEESRQLETLLKGRSIEEVIHEVTGLTDENVIQEIVVEYQKLI